MYGGVCNFVGFEPVSVLFGVVLYIIIAVGQLKDLACCDSFVGTVECGLLFG